MKKDLPIPIVIVTILVVIGVIYGVYAMYSNKEANYNTITPEMEKKMLTFPGALGGPPPRP